MQSGRVQNFKPSVNAFKFSNSFGADIPDAEIMLPPPFNSKIAIGSASNGVCGGMAFATADFFLSNPRLHIPTRSDTPGRGDPLTNYILRRLWDSFALDHIPSNVVRYLDAMSVLDHDTWVARGVPWYIAHDEWPKIKADIDSNSLSPIGLVGGAWVWPTNLSAKIKMLGECHVVLAYGYDLDDANNLEILVYDCNDPGNDNSKVKINIGNPEHTTPIETPDITANSGSHIIVRAFFRIGNYNAVAPEPGLSPGVFQLSASFTPAGDIPLNTPVTIQFDAKDVTTGVPASGTVAIDKVIVGNIGAQITATFKARYTRGVHIDPRTHQRTYHWDGPVFPVVTLSAENYSPIYLRPKFSGAVPPPPPNDPDL